MPPQFHRDGEQFRHVQPKPLLPAQPYNATNHTFKMARATPPIIFDSHFIPPQVDPLVQSGYRLRLGESPDPLQSTPEPSQSDPSHNGTPKPSASESTESLKSNRDSNLRDIEYAITADANLSNPKLHLTPGPVIEVNQNPYQSVLDADSGASAEKRMSSNHRIQHVMPDGRLINGKGLGRGRPGVKRGPRKSKLGSEMNGDEIAHVDQELAPPLTPTTRTETGKRKRSSSVASTLKTAEAPTTPASKESTPEYNPTSTQTRSGRQSQKPVSLAVSSSNNASPATKRSSMSNSAQSPSVKKHPKIKAKVYRGREQFALCEHCLRGYGPPGNVIVFCDACNKCWHQNCHTPRISKEVVADTKAEWFCADCDRILHGKKKQKLHEPQAPPATPSKVASMSVSPRFGPPLVGAAALPLAQRKQYLQTLSKERLIDVILRAGDLAPQLPMFETPVTQPQTVPIYTAGPEPQFASTYVTPVDTVRPPVASGADMDDEGYDDSFDEHAALYPRPGEGVKLPAESMDLHMLLESSDSRTFSHWIRGMPMRVTV